MDARHDHERNPEKGRRTIEDVMLAQGRLAVFKKTYPTLGSLAKPCRHSALPEKVLSRNRRPGCVRGDS
jgi:hypothetical protein